MPKKAAQIVTKAPAKQQPEPEPKRDEEILTWDDASESSESEKKSDKSDRYPEFEKLIDMMRTKRLFPTNIGTMHGRRTTQTSQTTLQT